MKQTPEMIREQRFKIKLSGFDKDEVINYLIDIADDIEELLEENNLLKSELESLRSKKKDLEDIFLSAKQFSEERAQKADSEAQKIIANAEQKASLIQQEAQHKVIEAEHKYKEIHTQTEIKSKELLADVHQKKASLEQEIVDLVSKKSNLVSELKAVLSSYQNWVKELENVDKKQR